MASTSASCRTASTPAKLTVFPDEIWEEIFVRLDAAADVIRVSASCSSFSRIVSARRFLRRFQSLHSPPVLGFISLFRYGRHGFIFLPVAPPHRSAPKARALVQAADFTFSFLPDPQAWRSRHARDGRVLLSRPISATTSGTMSATIAFEDFLVCDPLHRRYVKIPRIPDDLMASDPFAWDVLPVLVPAGENEQEESFIVICAVQLEDKVVAFVFSSCNQTWRGIISTICLPDGVIEYTSYYAHGCLYWMFSRMDYSLMLNTSDMEFSLIELPPQNFHSKSAIVNFDQKRAIVEAGDGRLGFLTIVDGTIDLYSKNWQSNGVSAQEWLHNKLIPLPKQSMIIYDWQIEGTTGRYLALAAHSGTRPYSEHFVLDIKTLLVEKLCTSNNLVSYGFPYARFPPPLAPPSI